MIFDSNDVLIAFCIIVLMFLILFVFGLVNAIHMVELSVMPAIWTTNISTVSYECTPNGRKASGH